MSINYFLGFLARGFAAEPPFFALAGDARDFPCSRLNRGWGTGWGGRERQLLSRGRGGRCIWHGTPGTDPGFMGYHV